VANGFTKQYGDRLTGSYANYPLGYNPGRFRLWWRRWHGESDDELDDAHLMRLVGKL
jgi:hypothetical protein